MRQCTGEKQSHEGPREELKKRDLGPGDCRELLPSPGEGADIGPGCSRRQDAESAATLEGKILTAVNKFLTTSPLVNKVKLLMVSLALSRFCVSLYLPFSPSFSYRHIPRMSARPLTLGPRLVSRFLDVGGHMCFDFALNAVSSQLSHGTRRDCTFRLRKVSG